jgi:hypothetical protein
VTKHYKAKQVADALMKPPTDELSVRQERLERRKQSNPRPFTSLAPATVAAVATAVSMSLLNIDPIYAVVFGIVMGWTIGPFLLGGE